MYPSTLSNFTDPTPTNRLNAPSHSSIESAQNAGIEAIEAFVGTLASTAGTLIYDIRSPSSNGGGHVQEANKGGTGQTTFTKGDILVATNSSTLTKVAVGGAGQILVVNADTATGTSWGSVTGVPSSVKTLVPRHPLATTIIISGDIDLNSQSVAAVGMVHVSSPIRVSVLSFSTGDEVSVGAADTLDLTLYKEDGTASIFTVVSPTISNGSVYARIIAHLPVVKNVDQGNYYMMVNRNNGNGGRFKLQEWALANSSVKSLSNIAGLPVLGGTYAIAGGAPPASIVATGITPSLSTETGTRTLFFRLDG